MLPCIRIPPVILHQLTALKTHLEGLCTQTISWAMFPLATLYRDYQSAIRMSITICSPHTVHRFSPTPLNTKFSAAAKQKINALSNHPRLRNFSFRRTRIITMAARAEVLPPILDASSNPPSLFDGTTRLYIAYHCPYAQRTWITRNYKGLQEKMQLVAINLDDRPAWYKEKLYPGNKVPSLEYNNEVKGESIDLVKYIDENFGGPKLLPDDPVKRKFAEELISYSDSFNKTIFIDLPAKGDVSDEVASAFDKLEHALSKFDDGPFFLGEFSQVDIIYAPFIERFQLYFSEFKKYDITKGRPNLAKWIEELNKIDAYVQTKRDPEEHLTSFKKRFGIK